MLTRPTSKYSYSTKLHEDAVRYERIRDILEMYPGSYEALEDIFDDVDDIRYNDMDVDEFIVMSVNIHVDDFGAFDPSLGPLSFNTTYNVCYYVPAKGKWIWQNDNNEEES